MKLYKLTPADLQNEHIVQKLFDEYRLVPQVVGNEIDWRLWCRLCKDAHPFIYIDLPKKKFAYFVFCYKNITARFRFGSPFLYDLTEDSIRCKICHVRYPDWNMSFNATCFLCKINDSNISTNRELQSINEFLEYKISKLESLRQTLVSLTLYEIENDIIPLDYLDKLKDMKLIDMNYYSYIKSKKEKMGI